MARLANAILQNNTEFIAGRQNAIVDLRYGGQLGYAPDMTQWVSNQSYVRRNLICLLVEAPRGFQYLTEPDKWVSTLRSLVELHPLTIDGLAQGYEVQVEDTSPVGGGGEMHQDFVNVTRARSNPVFRWNEKYGMAVSSFFRAWIQNLIMDPDSKVANIATITGQKPTDMLADMYSMTCAFIEPDPLHQKVVKSWLSTNMYPLGTGEITGRRELTASGEAVTHDINFTAISQTGIGVDAFCQTLLDSMSVVGANPSRRQAFVDGITADVAKQSEGYGPQVSGFANTALQV